MCVYKCKYSNMKIVDVLFKSATYLDKNKERQGVWNTTYKTDNNTIQPTPAGHSKVSD